MVIQILVEAMPDVSVERTLDRTFPSRPLSRAFDV